MLDSRWPTVGVIASQSPRPRFVYGDEEGEFEACPLAEFFEMSTPTAKNIKDNIKDKIGMRKMAK